MELPQSSSEIKMKKTADSQVDLPYRAQSLFFPEEVILLSSPPTTVLTSCYSPSPGQHGWCATVPSLSQAGDTAQEFDVRPDRGWGFCRQRCTDEYKRELMEEGELSIGEIMMNKTV